VTISTAVEARSALDKVIRKQRTAFYKPVQLAEVLHRVCCPEREKCDSAALTPFRLRTDLENYRVSSRHWRDVITQQLVGNVSTSSARYQDDLFNENAVSPRLLSILGEENCRYPRVVERYIYQAFWLQLRAVHQVFEYIQRSQKHPQDFTLAALFEHFKENALRRSIDKAYEITVYALFDTLVQHLKAQVTLSVDADEPQTRALLREFEDFTRLVLGVDAENPSVTRLAAFYRAGVTNAADRGVDVWANFGPVVQVKHLSLSPELAQGISKNVGADWLIIVCEDAEAETIAAVLKQLGVLGFQVREIITRTQLEVWYTCALRGKFASLLATDLLKMLLDELSREFPSVNSARVFLPFYTGRGYADITPCDSVFWRDDPWND